MKCLCRLEINIFILILLIIFSSFVLFARVSYSLLKIYYYNICYWSKLYNKYKTTIFYEILNLKFYQVYISFFFYIMVAQQLQLLHIILMMSGFKSDYNKFKKLVKKCLWEKAYYISKGFLNDYIKWEKYNQLWNKF